MDEYEKFYARIWKSGGSLVITVPSTILKNGRFCEGDDLKVQCRKAPKDDD